MNTSHINAEDITYVLKITGVLASNLEDKQKCIFKALVSYLTYQLKQFPSEIGGRQESKKGTMIMPL